MTNEDKQLVSIATDLISKKIISLIGLRCISSKFDNERSTISILSETIEYGNHPEFYRRRVFKEYYKLKKQYSSLSSFTFDVYSHRNTGAILLEVMMNDKNNSVDTIVGCCKVEGLI